MKRLVVNADDLGLSSAINAGIIQSHWNGIVTSASLVAAGQAFDEAVHLARRYPRLGVGVHLTLVEENSVAPALPTLAPHGVLPRSYGELVRKVCLGQIRLREIEDEFRAQVEKCLRAGIHPTHLDSHQHTHALPLLFPIALRVANDYKIPAIRIPRGFPQQRDLSAHRFAGKCILCLFGQADTLLFRRRDVKSTERFAGLFESGALTEDRLLHILNALRPGTTELMAHPACHDASPCYASWNLRRQLELASLTSRAAQDAIRRLGIELIHYGQL